MSWKHAPLVLRSHDLAVWLAAHRRVDGSGALLRRAETQACRLAELLAEALSFPKHRDTVIDRADRATLDLRTTVRIARDARQMRPAAARHVLAELDVIGRMLGGWRKSRRARSRATPASRGRAESAVPTASCAAAPTGTTPRTADPPTATGTTPLTATTTSTTTTTSASASPSPPRSRARFLAPLP